MATSTTTTVKTEPIEGFYYDESEIEIGPTIKIEESSVSIKSEPYTDDFVDTELSATSRHIKQEPLEHTTSFAYQFVKPYKCPKCAGEFYMEKYHFHDHLKSHFATTKVFICEYCSKCTTRKAAIVRHMQVHGATIAGNLKASAKYDQKLICETCNKTFRDKYTLSMHLKRGHNREWRCPYCKDDAVFANSNDLREHKNAMHGGNHFACDYCAKTFSERKFFKRHLDAHKAGRDHLCTQCGRGFCDVRSLRLHRQRIHDKPFSCDLCNIGFGDERRLKIHRSKYHAIVAVARQHSEIFEIVSKPYKCEECNRLFVEETEFEKHVHWHSYKKADNDKYNCTQCDKGFASKWGLYRHNKQHGTVHECQLCDFVGATAKDLKMHGRIEHSTEPGFPCPVCGVRLKQKCSVTRHMRIHTGDKPFECQECPRKFKQSSELTKHMQISHVAAQFVCVVCDFRTTLSSYLWNHEMRHVKNETDKKCRKCVVVCGGIDELKAHLESSHATALPIHCVMCSKVFDTVVDLDRHTVEADCAKSLGSKDTAYVDYAADIGYM